MPKTKRFLAVVTVAAGAMVGGLAAYAAPMSSLGALPQATGSSSMVMPVGYWNCWYNYGCKYCKWCWYSYGHKYCGDVKKTCYHKKKKRSYYY